MFLEHFHLSHLNPSLDLASPFEPGLDLEADHFFLDMEGGHFFLDLEGGHFFLDLEGMENKSLDPW